MKITEMFCSMMQQIWSTKRIELKAKIITKAPIELIKFMSCYDGKKYVLQMDTVDYHISINLFVNHTKIISLNIDNLLSFSV